MNNHHLPLRPNVCMLVYNSEGRLLLGERAGATNVWQFPQGGAEPEFSLEENVLRELEEELGADRKLFSITKKLHATHEYIWQEVPEYYVDKWSGQKQTFWLVQFLGKDEDIKLDHDELMNWRWCTTQEVKNLAEPKRIAGYLQPLREFEDFLLLKDETL